MRSGAGEANEATTANPELAESNSLLSRPDGTGESDVTGSGQQDEMGDRRSFTSDADTTTEGDSSDNSDRETSTVEIPVVESRYVAVVPSKEGAQPEVCPVQEASRIGAENLQFEPHSLAKTKKKKIGGMKDRQSKSVVDVAPNATSAEQQQNKLCLMIDEAEEPPLPMEARRMIRARSRNVRPSLPAKYRNHLDSFRPNASNDQLDTRNIDRGSLTMGVIVSSASTQREDREEGEGESQSSSIPDDMSHGPSPRGTAVDVPHQTTRGSLRQLPRSDVPSHIEFEVTNQIVEAGVHGDDEESPAISAYTISTAERDLRIRRMIMDSAPLVDGTVAPSSAASSQSIKPSFQCRRVALIVGVIVVLVVALVTPLAIMNKGSADKSKNESPAQDTNDTLTAAPSMSAAPTSMPTETPTVAPTSERFGAIKSVLVAASGEEVLDDLSSPQYRSMTWLVEEDGRMVDWNDTKSIIQRYALATLFFSTGGETSWTNKFNFLSPDHECKWSGSKLGERVPFGASCAEEEEGIDTIFIEKNNMTGSIPDEVRLLSKLRALHLLGGNIARTIPPSIGELQELELLTLQEHDITGTMPSSIGELTSLDGLYLAHNRLIGTAPGSIVNLTGLRQLHLQGNWMIGSFPLPKSFPHMKGLFLSGNNFTGSISKVLKTTPRLKEVDVTGNFFTGTIPRAIGGYRYLFHLALGANRISGSLPSFSNGLQHLDACSNMLTGEIPQLPFVYLSHLDLSSNRLNGTIPIGGYLDWGHVPPLEVLDLSENNLTGVIPSTIGDFSRLTSLSLHGNELNGTVPSTFSQLASLKFLALENNELDGGLNFMCTSNALTTLKADCLGGAEAEVACACCNWCCNSEGHCTPKEIPTFGGRFEAIKLVLQSVSCQEDLEDTSSPQHVALVWLAKEDSAWLGVNETKRLIQRYALATFYFATGGKHSWRNQHHFLSDRHECEWHDDVDEGVFCREDPNIVDEVSIRANGVHGRLPAELWLLTNATRVELGRNSLSGTITEAVGNMTKVSILDLSENHLVGHTPPILAGMTSMRTLKLHGNDLSGSVDFLCNTSITLSSYGPSVSCACCNSNCHTSGVCYVPSFSISERFLAIQANLSAVSFVKDNLANSSSPEYRALQWLAFDDRVMINTNDTLRLVQRYALATLYFSTGGRKSWHWKDKFLSRLHECSWNDGIQSFSFSALGAWCHGGDRDVVNDINLRENNLRGTLPSDLALLAGLEYVDLGINELKGEIPVSFGKLSSLRVLSLSRNGLAGVLPLAFRNLTNLSNLQLHNNTLSGNIEFLCDDRFYSLRADCLGKDPDISCSCCTECCDETQCCDNNIDLSSMGVPCFDV